MAQFYLLSVVLNLLCALILVYGHTLAKDNEDSLGDDDVFQDEEKSPAFLGDLSALDSPVFRLVVGVMSIFVALMKVLSVFKGDVAVIGDILPVIAGIFAGLSLLLEYYISSSAEEVVVSDSISTVFIDSRKYIGIACFVVAVLHFIFPQVVLL